MKMNMYLKKEKNYSHLRLNTPPIAEIIGVKNVRAFVVCGFFMK